MIRFKKEYTPLATHGRVRLGIAHFETPGTMNKTMIEIIKKRLETGRLSYDICVSRGKGWTWFWDVPYKKIESILNKASIIKMANEF